ncbi:unnamed protein product [Rhizoctonia solani]|uniref:Superoxide dismutase n=1 Tax=Rhizoctonia solani TaxID=456999 RepID=A0A8H3C4C9_9AGAM|nr:unnamed protein product [Rhizoctonia solani]CAE7222697.1 unnamed protein product [Rhizoctonia solani]
MSKVTLPDLPYEYHALEPHISKEIMELHHKKHHQTYVNGYNTAIETLSKLVGDPSAARQQIALQSAVKFNGGGHLNHSLFWRNLAPAGTTGLGKNEKGELAIEPPNLHGVVQRDFGGFDRFQQEFNAAALGIQGSGWAWLVWNTSKERAEIVTTPNQDPVLPPYVPLFGVDMWEHAFYLQYKNVKPDYLAAIWNVINFHEAERRLQESTST